MLKTGGRVPFASLPKAKRGFSYLPSHSPSFPPLAKERRRRHLISAFPSKSSKHRDACVGLGLGGTYRGSEAQRPLLLSAYSPVLDLPQIRHFQAAEPPTLPWPAGEWHLSSPLTLLYSNSTSARVGWVLGNRGNLIMGDWKFPEYSCIWRSFSAF